MVCWHRAVGAPQMAYSRSGFRFITFQGFRLRLRPRSCVWPPCKVPNPTKWECISISTFLSTSLSLSYLSITIYAFLSTLLSIFYVCIPVSVFFIFLFFCLFHFIYLNISIFFYLNYVFLSIFLLVFSLSTLQSNPTNVQYTSTVLKLHINGFIYIPDYFSFIRRSVNPCMFLFTIIFIRLSLHINGKVPRYLLFLSAYLSVFHLPLLQSVHIYFC